MTSQALHPRSASHRHRGDDRWRRWWPTLLLLALFGGAGYVIGQGTGSDAGPDAAPSATVREAAASAGVTKPGPPVLESTTEPAAGLDQVLQLPGAVPAHGLDTFHYSGRTGRILGSSGVLRRFRVGVEDGSGEDVEEFAGQVEATLGDGRGWIAGGLRLQQVGDGQPYDFTVLLATRDTTYRLCLLSGTDTRVGGVSTTSCRTPGKAIVNLDRWRLSSAPYLSAKASLQVYRRYVVNHEVGHELGHHHEGCPRQGGPAPVMVQQTLTLRGCVPNSWPYPNGKLLSGPYLR